MRKKIRVLHILDELDTGGAEKIVVDYFKNVDREKFQWDFIITKYDDPNKVGLLEKVVCQLGGNIYKVTRKRVNYMKNIAETNEIIKNGNYDIVHSHLDELSAFYLMSAKKYKVPVRICHSHLAGTSRGRLVEILCKILKPLLYFSVTNKFACGVEAGKTLWGIKAVEKGDVYIMHNAIDIDKFVFNKAIRKEKRKELNVDDKIVVGSVGRLSYQKNPEKIIDIFKKYHEAQKSSVLLMIGIGDKLEELKKIVKNYNIEDSVLFLSRRTDINELMMAMDFFLLPSRFEGLPIVLVEAQCTGLTCIVSNKITKEIKINDNLFFMDISSKSDEWIKYMNLDSAIIREDAYIKVESFGYEINNETVKLEEYYMKALMKYDEKNI